MPVNATTHTFYKQNVYLNGSDRAWSRLNVWKKKEADSDTEKQYPGGHPVYMLYPADGV
jgi:hypothetical protein